jgi:hypothetical protein
MWVHVGTRPTLKLLYLVCVWGGGVQRIDARWQCIPLDEAATVSDPGVIVHGVCHFCCIQSKAQGLGRGYFQRGRESETLSRSCSSSTHGVVSILAAVGVHAQLYVLRLEVWGPCVLCSS